MTNMIALGVKHMFVSRWTHKEDIYASFPTFYASETGDAHVDGSLKLSSAIFCKL